MKWMLIYIVVKAGVPYAVNSQGPYKTFDKMNQCFMARDRLSETVGVGNGYFGPNKQAVCIQVTK